MTPVNDPFDDPVNYEVEPEPLDTAAEAYALDQADWHLRRIAAETLERGQLADTFHRELERIKARMSDRLATIDARIAWHRRPLNQFHAALLDRDPTRKTITLPHGALTSRTTTTPTVVIDDPAALAAWARDCCPQLLPPARTVKVSDLRQIATVAGDGKVVNTTTGEVIPGAGVQPPGTTFSYSIADDGEPF